MTWKETSVPQWEAAAPARRPWWASIKEPGSALQIITAALTAITIGLGVGLSVDEVPEAATVLLMIPGNLWLRALKAVVLPLIVTAMILAAQKLREMSRGGSILARWTIGYYVGTTFLAITHSVVAMSLGWRRLMTVMPADQLAVPEEEQRLVEERKAFKIHMVIEDMFESLVPENVAQSLASDHLLAVLVTSIVVGYLIKGPNSSILRATAEIEKIIMVVITFLIKCAPIGVFFLVLPNFFRLNGASVGQNLGVLIAACLTGIAFHLFVVLPIIFFAFTRHNPYTYWMKNAPAWLTAWGSASSAGTLPVTMRCAQACGFPVTVRKFALPLGALMNMDGTAIYYPVGVVFLAQTQGIELNPAQYVVLVLLSALASIGTTPIPSASLVLIVMIAGSAGIPITGMYAVIVAIDWFLDRFRTTLNVSGDLFAVAVLTEVTGITDPDDTDDTDFVKPRHGVDHV